MTQQNQDLQLVDVTELLSHLYLGLPCYLDWLLESSQKSDESESRIKPLIQDARGGLEKCLSENPVVHRIAEEECTLRKNSWCT